MGRSNSRKGEVGVGVRKGGSKGGGRKGENRRNRRKGEEGIGRGTWWREGPRVGYMWNDLGERVDRWQDLEGRTFSGRTGMQTWSGNVRDWIGVIQTGRMCDKNKDGAI